MTNTADDTGYAAYDDEMLYREYVEDTNDDPYDGPDQWDDPAEFGWDDDSHLAQWDDDPNPYHGDYSEM